MNNGYTPIFGSLTTGTLCGKWPDIGLWAIVLALADWRGVVDATPHYISSVTGLPVDDVKACMRRFCEPDPDSRSKEEGGARLVLVDPARGWGWRVVNIQLYRNRASGQDQIADGRNAEKVRRYKERHRETPKDTSGHRETPPDTNSDSYADSNPSKKDAREARLPDSPEGETPRKRRGKAQCQLVPLPTDFALSERMREQALKRHPDADVDAWFEGFCAHHRAHGKAMSDWHQAWITWIGNGVKFGYPRRKEAGRANGGLQFAN